MLVLGEALILEGMEVRLRPLTASDADSLAVAASESRQSYRFNPVPDGPSEAREWIALALVQRGEGERYPFAVEWRGRLVGSTSYWGLQPWLWPANCALQRDGRPDAVEIGSTWLAASAQRTRCNTEAKYLLLVHAFGVWQVHRVSLRTDERNARSRRAIERLGAKFDGVLRADMPGNDCSVRNSAYYSILRSEWPEVKQALELRLATSTGV